MKLVHNNEHYYEDCHVFSDKEYDYSIVNGESISRYYGSKGGQYESCPVHTLVGSVYILINNPYILKVLAVDAYTTRHYKHYSKLIESAKKDRKWEKDYGKNKARIYQIDYVISKLEEFNNA